MIGLLWSANTIAQQKSVRGTVMDELGDKIPGVNVIIKGTSTGTITDINGEYTITINNASQDVLLYSFIGFDDQEVVVGNQELINVILKTEFTQLDEVVAIGYGGMKKKDLTGAIASVNVVDMEKMPVANVAQAMAGRVAGVQITTSEGEPGAGIAIRIRGGGSITQSNEPLYVIDGFPSEDGLSALDPSDIESIDILKDASSTAIYGARGANGVVVVTTKGGTVRKTTVNFDAYYGIKQLSKRLDVMNPYDFVKMDYERETLGQPFTGDLDEEGNPELTEAYKTHANNYGLWEQHDDLYTNRPGVDWQDETLGDNAYIQNYKVSVNGGTKSVRYNLAYSHFDDEGIMVASGFKRDNAKLKLDLTPNDRLEISTNINYTKQEKYGNGTSSGNDKFNRLSHIIQYRPTIGIKGEDEDLINMDEDPILENDDGNVMQNPIASAYAEHRSYQRKVLAMNASMQYEILPNLFAKISGGLRDENRRTEIFDGSRSITARRNSIQGSLRNDEIMSFNNINLLMYKTKINKHKIDLTAGNENNYREGRWFRAGASGFPNDDIGLADLSLGATPDIPASYEYDATLISFFGRAFYSYKQRYLMTVTYRADGSSKFGADNKWGYFPAASVAWRANEEAFIKDLNVFSNLKLRLGYGKAGNNRIGDYNSLSTLSGVTYPLNGTAVIGVQPDRLANPNLKWETTTTLNFGLEMGFFNQRIQLTSEFYQNKVSDLLLNATIPYSSGYANRVMNIGATENRGMEFILSTVNVQTQNFTWTSDFNISFNKNKVTSLVGDQEFFLYDSGWNSNITGDYIVKVGDPVGQMFGWETEGIYGVNDFEYDANNGTYTLKEGIADDPNNPAQPGSWKYKDIAGAFDENGNPIPDGVIDTNDRKVIGNANPVHYGGLTNTFSYKNIDLSVFLNWSWGNDVYNASKLFYSGGDRSNKNALAVVNNRWTDIDENGLAVTDPTLLAEMNEGADVARIDELNLNGMRPHSWAIEDASFLRISNISLGYNLPKRWLQKVKVNRCRVYFTSNNLYTFTNYTGFDPEVSTKNGSGITPGVDFGAYPRNKSYVFGMNLSF
ncbi:TonB-dependent receptor [Carboxylicivirga sp. M1479]|uniref:SusC/RagA family TonB-linked outer membrane protein n=2 Tax=Carboxylicivirga TaxID=1628153 RepID=UPI001C8F8CB8|nr:TonB-dependent receptor [Carboxylicivirga sp. M1479]